MTIRSDMTAVSPRAVCWSAAAFASGVLLSIDRTALWISLVALGCVAWRLMALGWGARLPGTALRTVLALSMVIAVLLRFRTLNGLEAGTALLILTGAVKLLETRTSRDLFIVIGAALFLLLAACLDRQTLLRAPIYLVHAWICCTALGIVSYGRSAPASAAGSFADRSLFDDRTAILLAARTLALALPLAAALFLFFPRLPGSFWAIPLSQHAMTGLGDSMSPGSIAELTASYTTAFRVRFDGEPPPVQERYWRGPVLHAFDGYTWHRSAAGFIPRQPLAYLGTAYHYRISLEPSSRRWWYSLDTADGSPSSQVFFTYDYQLISAEPVTAPTGYSAVSHTQTRAVTELSSPERAQDSTLPDDRNPRSRALAQRLRAGAPTDAAFVRAVLDHLRRGGFRYSLTPPLLGRDSVDDFLFATRSGFCGHYASAFVSLMRAGGVPARVVTGYLGGEWNPIGGYFVVRQSDAHSWAEVWLSHRGWTRVDPTAVVAPERLRRGILDLLPDAVSAPARLVWSTPWLAATLQRWDALNAWWTDRVVNFGFEDQLRILQRLGFASPSLRELGWVFAAALIGWLTWIAWQFGLPGRAAAPDRLARAYARLCRKLARIGLTRQPHQGPLAFAAEVRRSRPDLAEPVGALILHYIQLRYGANPTPMPATALNDFERAVARFKAVRAARSRRRRPGPSSPLRRPAPSAERAPR